MRSSCSGSLSSMIHGIHCFPDLFWDHFWAYVSHGFSPSVSETGKDKNQKHLYLQPNFVPACCTMYKGGSRKKFGEEDTMSL